MAGIPQIRGALLEEAILYLLEQVGYTIIEFNPGMSIEETGLNRGHSGLEVRGRGTWHQIDALAALDHSPAFLYPLRLMVEAKCYQANRPVGVEVVRNAVGVLKDISENYFTMKDRHGSPIQVPRYNYHSAIFSTSGFTSGSVDYSVAHQVFLIEYKNVPVIQPLIDTIMGFDNRCVTKLGRRSLAQIRRVYRKALKNSNYIIESSHYLTDCGLNLIKNSMVETTLRIKGSYFGMLQGRWPMHLLTSRPLSAEAFKSDCVYCQLTGNRSGEWGFTPIGVESSDSEWFELQFHLPKAIASLVSEYWDERETVAILKQEHFSYINLSGKIGGIRRSIQLKIDREWIQEYLENVRRTEEL